MRLYPLPSLYDDSVAAVKAATPVNISSFYVRRPLVVPWSVLPTTFVLETDRPDLPHLITVNGGDSVSLIPGLEAVAIQLQLQQGVNDISIESPAYAHRGDWSASRPYNRFETVASQGRLWLSLQPSTGVLPVEGAVWTQDIDVMGDYRAENFSVAATGVETWFRALGREFYLEVGSKLDEINRQLSSPWTTRVTSHLLPYSTLFLPSQMPKIHQTRLAMVTSMGRTGSGDGVTVLASALTYSTPYVTRARDNEFSLPGRDFLYPGVTSHPTTGELRGRVFDVWSPNVCAASKLAFVKLVSALGSRDTPSPKSISLVDFNDNGVIVESDGVLENHTIDPSSSDCNQIEYNSSCDSEVRVYATMESRIDSLMNSPQLPFDEVVESPLNFGVFDEGSSFDMSEGSGEPGLGGGDEHFDTVDEDDPFGTGFLGVSLSRRMDAPACFDTRIQRGERSVKHVYPLESSYPDPEDHVTGTRMRVDTVSAGAPTAALGTTSVWATTKQVFIFQGDYVRHGNSDYRILSAWPVDSGLVAKTGTVTITMSGGKFLATSATAIFEKRHEGMGLLTTASPSRCSIASVSDDGLTAVLAGNPSITTGATAITIYYPKRDRLATTGAPFAGDRVMELTLATSLVSSLTDQQAVDLRRGVLSVGTHSIGATTIQVATDLTVVPGDYLWLTSSSSIRINDAVDTGVTHHTTGLRVWELQLDSTLPSLVTNDQSLYSISTDPCWETGDPVTPLMVISMFPSAYLSLPVL